MHHSKPLKTSLVRSPLRRIFDLAAFAAIPAMLALPAFTSGGCSSSSSDSVCGSEPDTAVCGRLGYECGSVTICYVCGVSKRVDCGACADTQTCGGGGTPNVCWPPLADASAEAGDDAVDAGVDSSDTDASVADASTDADASPLDGAITDASADTGIDATLGAGSDASSDASVTDPGVFVLCPDDAVPPLD